MQYDWVFGTDYQGELASATPSSEGGSLDAAADTQIEGVDGADSAAGTPSGGGPRWEPAGPGVIDRALLQATEQPILYYADVPLYEDELHDHGAVQLAAKIRVMPTCVFVAAAFRGGGLDRWNDGDIYM